MPAGRRILMLGSRFDVRGGVSAMASQCADAGLFARWNAEYLATHRDGGAVAKVAQAAGAWLRFARLAATGRVALMHVHLNSDASFWRKAAFLVPAATLGIPYVAHIHCGGFAAFHRERCGPRAQRFVRRVLEGAHAVVVLTEAQRDELAAAFPGVAMQVIPNPVAIPAAKATPDPAAPTVLFLGVIREEKGAFDLVRAWPRVVARVPSARLVVAGTGEVEALRALAGELGIAASVETPGWIDAAERARRLSTASLVALPSHREALPMSILEAMAAGVPVVASRVGGIPCAVEDGRSGILVPAGDVERISDALVAVLGDPARQQAMAIAARTRAESAFAASRVVARLEALWRHFAPGCEIVRHGYRGSGETIVQSDYPGGVVASMAGQVVPAQYDPSPAPLPRSREE